ncbi:hypothetical protein B0H14DRAFT_3508447 [Mycena olivaceomarginata]|nr:hypothetical protein B0H14DRAFT_3508447 [Mycena olivaceomarginata]
MFSQNSRHLTIENCYWPGGGKEGQFPPNFGRNRPQARQTTADEEPPTHRVLMAAAARHVTIEEVEDKDAPRIVYPARKDTPLKPVEEIVPLVGSVPTTPKALALSGSTAPKALVSRTFENHSPAKAITFLDSGASDHFFRDRSDFRSYEAVAVRTGKSALASEGDFAIVGKGTVTKVFNVGGKEVHITFSNALHAPTLSANLVSWLASTTPHFVPDPGSPSGGPTDLLPHVTFNAKRAWKKFAIPALKGLTRPLGKAAQLSETSLS